MKNLPKTLIFGSFLNFAYNFCQVQNLAYEEKKYLKNIYSFYTMPNVDPGGKYGEKINQLHMTSHHEASSNEKNCLLL